MGGADLCMYNHAHVGGPQCEPFAEMAKLGENCEDATCYEGTCFRKYGQKNKYCKKLVNPGMYGCFKENTECVQGNVCVANRCERGVERTVDVDVKVKRNWFPDWKVVQWKNEDLFYNLAPMLIVGFLLFIIGIMYCMLFLS